MPPTCMTALMATQVESWSVENTKVVVPAGMMEVQGTVQGLS